MSKVAVEAIRLPWDVRVTGPFPLDLPAGAVILRGGLEPRSGAPALWYSFRKHEPQDVVRRYFIVIETEGFERESSIEYEGALVPCGTWWAAAQTYHLFEMLPEPE